MSKLTNEEWKLIEKELSSIYGHVEFRIDGYKVTLYFQQYKVFKNVIVIYIDNHIRGEWLSQDCEERRRFYQCSSRYAHTKKFRAALKRLGKKRLTEMNVDPDIKYSVYSPYWKSFKALKAHLLKNNTSIEWINKPERTTAEGVTL